MILITACKNRIETYQTLGKTDIDVIKSLRLLDTNERIIQFYSEYKNKNAGNFFTDRRMATYWIDPHDKLKDHANQDKPWMKTIHFKHNNPQINTEAYLMRSLKTDFIEPLTILRICNLLKIAQPPNYSMFECDVDEEEKSGVKAIRPRK